MIRTVMKPANLIRILLGIIAILGGEIALSAIRVQVKLGAVAIVMCALGCFWIKEHDEKLDRVLVGLLFLVAIVSALISIYMLATTHIEPLRPIWEVDIKEP